MNLIDLNPQMFLNKDSFGKSTVRYNLTNKPFNRYKEFKQLPPSNFDIVLSLYML